MPRLPAPCRLFVLLARNEPVGLVLRRGPAAWTQLIRWRTDRDEFESGQWFRGVIDFHRCDLSPSGERFLYFAKAYKPHSIALDIATRGPRSAARPTSRHWPSGRWGIRGSAEGCSWTIGRFG